MIEKLKFIIVFCSTCICISSCSNSKHLAKSSNFSENKTTATSSSKGSTKDINSIVLNETSDILLKSLDHLDTVKDVDPIIVRLQLNQFHFKQKITVDSNEIITFPLKKESDLIIFNQSVGFKFYRIVLNDNGKFRHFIKHDVFVLLNGKWEKIANGYLTESHINEANFTSLNASSSVKSTNYSYFIHYNFSK